MFARFAFAVVCVAGLFGCGPTLAEGTFACESSADCPSDWVCRADQRCYRDAIDDVDGGRPDAALVDAFTDATLPDGELPGDAGPSERSCGDAMDDDRDGLIDCADPDCAGQSCGGQSVSVDPCSSLSPCARTGSQTRSVRMNVCVGGECIEQTGAVSVACDRDSTGLACDDGLVCNGDDRCDGAGGCTVHLGGPCSGVECFEVDDTCGRCLGTGTCACSGVCGDANQDGSVNVLDASAAIAFADGGSRPSSCELESGDVDRDGEFTERDARGIVALAGGTVQGGCGTPCTGLCGDANQDGDIGLGDLNVVQQQDSPDVCSFLDGDAVQDQQLDIRDAFALFRSLSFGSSDLPPGACEPCELSCGDVNGDGIVGGGDITAIQNLIAMGLADVDACEFAAADVVSDGSLTERDVNAVRDIFLGRTVETGCATCEVPCGDVDDNRIIDVRDLAAIDELVGAAGPFERCILFAADVDGDGNVTTADRSRLLEYLRDGRDLECPE